MRKYTRLSDSGSLNDGALPEFSPPFATEYELNPTTRWGKVGKIPFFMEKIKQHANQEFNLQCLKK